MYPRGYHWIKEVFELVRRLPYLGCEWTKVFDPDDVQTPWGELAELRGARLHAGTQPCSRAETERHQRERLFAGTVAAVAERGGYTATRATDVARLSGVARSDLYKLLGSREDCFLAAVDDTHARARRMVRKAYLAEEGWEPAIRAAYTEMVELIVAQPAAAQMCVVSVYEAGPAGAERIDRASLAYERLLRRSVSQSERRAGLPGGVLSALIGAAQMLIHDRLRSGRPAELAASVDDALAWALSYETPPEELRRPAGPVADPEPTDRDAPRERLLRAIAAVTAEDGVQELSAGKVVARARASRRTFYQHFSDREDAFLQCFDAVRGRTLAAARAAFEPAMPDWPGALRAGLEAIFAYLASEPDFARVAFVEILGAGPKALKRRDEAVKEFTELFEPGFACAPELHPVAGEAIVFGLYSLARRQIIRHGPTTLPRIGPTACFFGLAPFIGAEQAARIANGNPPVGS
jgi:AcrR family transcriptional regulator